MGGNNELMGKWSTQTDTWASMNGLQTDIINWWHWCCCCCCCWQCLPVISVQKLSVYWNCMFSFYLTKEKQPQNKNHQCNKTAHHVNKLTVDEINCWTVLWTKADVVLSCVWWCITEPWRSLAVHVPTTTPDHKFHACFYFYTSTFSRHDVV